MHDDLVVQLTRARQLEIAAETFEQERNTVHATGALMLAGADAGGLTVDIAKAAVPNPDRSNQDAHRGRAGVRREEPEGIE